MEGLSNIHLLWEPICLTLCNMEIDMNLELIINHSLIYTTKVCLESTHISTERTKRNFQFDDPARHGEHGSHGASGPSYAGGPHVGVHGHTSHGVPSRGARGWEDVKNAHK